MQHRRIPKTAVKRDDADKPKKFGEIITIDHIVTMDDGIISVDGDSNSVTIRDITTGWMECHPTALKTAGEREAALKLFMGPNGAPGLVHSDGSGAIKAAVSSLGWQRSTGTPGRPLTNGVVERANRVALEGARTSLLQSGIHQPLWSRAMRYFSSMYNYSWRGSDSMTPYERRFVTSYRGRN
jgi:transposase InsO family protein